MLQDHAMLAQLTIKQWTAKKQDKKVTAEVEAHHNAHNAGRFNKDLVSKELLAPISKLCGATRDKHYEMTHAWNDNGQRLLPSALFMDYSQMIRIAKADHSKLMIQLMHEYPQEVQAARIRLGSMYNPGDYPDPSDLPSKFDLNAEFSPVPTAEDFRVDVGEENIKEIRAQITAGVHMKQEEAITATFARVKDVVSKIHERLSDPVAIFKDTLIHNCTDLCKVLNGLNITNDERISELRNAMRTHLIKSPQTIRDNPILRAEMARQAQLILIRLPQ